MKSLLIPMVSIGLVACGAGGDVPRNDDRCVSYEAVGVPCELPMAAILSDPGVYQGRNIQIMGFLGGRAAPGTLYSNREAWLSFDRSSSIRLSMTDSATADSLAKLKFSYVAVSGRLENAGIRTARQPNLMMSVDIIVVMYQPSDFSDHESRLIKEQGQIGSN